MSTKTRIVIGSIASISMLLLAGCSTATPTSSSTTPAPEKTVETVAESPAPTEDSRADCVLNDGYWSTGQAVSGNGQRDSEAERLGMVTPGKVVTDDKGTYCTVILDEAQASKKFLTLETSGDTDDLKEAGITDQELYDAQLWVANLATDTFLNTKFLDGGVDLATEYPTWVESDMANNIDAQMLKEFVEDPNYSLVASESTPFTMLRNGNPRVAEVTYTTGSIFRPVYEREGYEDADGITVRFSLSFTAIMSQENAVAFYQKYHPEMSADEVLALQGKYRNDGENTEIRMMRSGWASFLRGATPKLVGFDAPGMAIMYGEQEVFNDIKKD